MAVKYYKWSFPLSIPTISVAEVEQQSVRCESLEGVVDWKKVLPAISRELGARLEKFFVRFVAVVVLVLGSVTLDGGLNLKGSRR